MKITLTLTLAAASRLREHLANTSDSASPGVVVGQLDDLASALEVAVAVAGNPGAAGYRSATPLAVVAVTPDEPPPPIDLTRQRLEAIAAEVHRNFAGRIAHPEHRAYLVVDPATDWSGDRPTVWLSWSDVARHVLEHLDTLEPVTGEEPPA